MKFFKGGRALVLAIVMTGSTVSGVTVVAQAAASPAYAQCAPPSPQPGTDQALFVGDWHNVDSNGLITRVVIAAPDPGCNDNVGCGVVESPVELPFGNNEGPFGNNTRQCSPAAPPALPPNQYSVDVYGNVGLNSTCPATDCHWGSALANDHDGMMGTSYDFGNGGKSIWLWYENPDSNPDQQAYLRVDVYDHINGTRDKFIDREYLTQ
jgi:hypothetical protein